MGLEPASDPPSPMLGLLNLSGLPNPIGTELIFVGPPMLDKASTVRVYDSYCVALFTRAAAGVNEGACAALHLEVATRAGVGLTAKGKMD